MKPDDNVSYACPDASTPCDLGCAADEACRRGLQGTDAEVIARAERNGYRKHETLSGMWRTPPPDEMTCVSLGFLRLTPMCDDPDGHPSSHEFARFEIGERCYCGRIERIVDYDWEGNECGGFIWV